MEIKPVKEWSAAIMINHWAMALSIFVLIVTGFYIADPCTIYQGETVDKFFVGNMRYVHILFGIFLMFIFIWRLYLAFFSRFNADWKDFFAWLDFECTWKQIKFYLLIEKEPPSHCRLYLWTHAIPCLQRSFFHDLRHPRNRSDPHGGGLPCRDDRLLIQDLQTGGEHAGRTGNRPLCSPYLHVAFHSLYHRARVYGLLV